MKLFGRRRWCPLLICFSVLIFVLCVVLWSISSRKTITSIEQNLPDNWINCPGCYGLKPLHSSELDTNLLLILVHSAAKRRDAREAIRGTWLIDYQFTGPIAASSVHYSFVLGAADLSEELVEQLQQESSTYNDMMILPDNPDTALDLTQRTIESFKISMEKFEFLYVLKCDEDSYVDVPRLASTLQLRNKRIPLYWGELLTWTIYSQGLYGEKHFTVCERYLPYALGGGYVLSRDLVEVLATNAPFLHHYVSEDVSVGAWLAPLNIERIHDTRFDTGAKSRGCKDPYLVTHKVTSRQMYNYHKVYMQDGRFCSAKNRDTGVPGHMYIWTVKPSKCIKYSENLP